MEDMNTYASQTVSAKEDSRPTIGLSHIQLQDEIRELANHISKLEESLQSVLIPTEPDDSVRGTPISSNQSDLRIRINDSAVDIAALRYRISSLLQRIDL